MSNAKFDEMVEKKVKLWTNDELSLKDSEYWDIDKVKLWYKDRVDNIFNIAKNNTVFYKNYDKFDDVPIVYKRDIRVYPEDFINHNLTDRAVSTTTSGSTGEPFSYLSGHEDRGFIIINLLFRYVNSVIPGFINNKKRLLSIRMKKKGNQPINKNIVSFFINDGSMYGCSAISDCNNFNIAGLNALEYSLTDNELYDKIYKLVNDYKIDALLGPCTIFDVFVDYVRENNLSVMPLKFINTGEKMHYEQKEKIESVFGQRSVFDYFCSPDGSTIMYTCPEQGKWHVAHESCYVELVGDLMVSTSLYNYAQPFLRYHNGDVAQKIYYGECQCGRSGLMMEDVIGRDTDCFLDKNNKKISSSIIYSLFAGYMYARQWQIVQVGYDKFDFNYSGKLNPNEIKIYKNNILHLFPSASVNFNKVPFNFFDKPKHRCIVRHEF